MHSIRSALVALTWLTPVVLAQSPNSVDKEIFSQFKHSYADANGASFFDMAYTGDGKLIVAFVEERKLYDDRVIVAEFDPTTSVWLKLVDTSLYMAKIRELSLATSPMIYGDGLRDRWYLACVMSNPDPNGGPVDQTWLTLLHGEIHTKWGPWVTTCTMLPPLGDSSLDLHPSCAVVPSAPADWKNYTVQVAFTWPEFGGAPGGPIWVATSYDYGNSFGDEQMVAGPKGSMIDTIDPAGKSPSGLFGAPSLCADPNNGSAMLAFEDRTRKSVQVGSGKGSSKLSWVDEILAKGARKWAPAIAADESDVNIVCRAGEPDKNGSTPLVWFVGTSFGLFTAMPMLHSRCVSAPDIAVNENTAFIVAACLPDNSNTLRVLAFENDRDNALASPVNFAVDDVQSALGAPKVAITPDNLTGFKHSYAWRRVFTNPPQSVFLDL